VSFSTQEGQNKRGLAGKGYEVVMTAVRAAHPGKTVFHDPAVEVFAAGGGDDLSKISVLLFIPFRIDFFIFLKMLVGDSIKIALFRRSPLIYSARHALA
jgi:hypothetical protein